MKEKNVSYVLHLKNGNVEPLAPIEIDGEKFEANPEKPEEALLKDGEKVPFKEPEAPAETEEEKTAREKKEKEAVDLSKMSIDEIAKLNPAVAKAMEDGTTAVDALAKIEKDTKEAKEKKAEDDGEWQSLANERGEKIKTLETDKTKQDEILTKYKGSINAVLKEVESTIPEDKKSLIPAGFSPRQRLEYISQNAKFLGAKTIANIGDGKAPENEKTPDLTDEQTLATEVQELADKPNKTQTELDLLYDKSKKLKQLRSEKKQ